MYWKFNHSEIIMGHFGTFSRKYYYSVKIGSYRICIIIELSTASVDISNPIKINGNLS